MEHLSRRRFLKISAATFGATPSRRMGAARAHGGRRRRRRREPSPPFRPSARCLLALRRHCARRDGKLWKLRAIPGPQSRGRRCPARHRRIRCVLRPRPPAEAPDPPRRAQQGRMDGGDLGRGVRLHRRPDAENQGAIRARVGGDVQPRDRPALRPAHAEVVGGDQLRRIVVRAMPRPPRRRLRAHLRHRLGSPSRPTSRTPMPRPHRHAFWARTCTTCR